MIEIPDLNKQHRQHQHQQSFHIDNEPDDIVETDDIYTATNDDDDDNSITNEFNDFNDNNIKQQQIEYGLNIIPNLKEHSINFKLQHPANLEIPRTSTPEDLDQVGQLKSPISAIIPIDHTQPSPQLPPPLSSIPLQKLTLSQTNNEEFGSIRKGLATDLKTPVEYTLHIVFTQFVRHTERKLNQFLDFPLHEEPPILKIFEKGKDPVFDKILKELGYIAKRKPKPVIDTIMFWRKSKGEVAALAALEIERVISIAKTNLNKVSDDNKSIKNSTGSKRSLSLMRSKSISKLSHKRNQSVQSLEEPMHEEYIKQKQYYDLQIANARQTAIHAEKKSIASIYILCRVLIEIVEQASNAMDEDLGDKLEEIVYTQLKTTDPTSSDQSMIRAANWNLFAQLLGVMSKQRFISVSDRFISDIEQIPKDVKPELQPKLYLLINGMRYLRLKNYPIDEFEESAEFIQSLAKFFSLTTNDMLLYGYCDVLNSLILPLAKSLTAEVNYPTWVEAIDKIYKKGIKMWKSNLSSPMSANLPLFDNHKILTYKSSSWSYSITLITAALSVSRKDLFQNWFQFIEDNSSKLKPKVDDNEKTIYITSISRLTWVYLNRFPDTLNNTIKRLDSLFQLLFFNPLSKKQQWITLDSNLITALTELITIVGYTHINYILEHVLIKLIHSFHGTIESINPEKLIIAIKSYISILTCIEFQEKPSFPIDDFEIKESGEFTFTAKSATNLIAHQEISKSLGSLLQLFDQHYGNKFNEPTQTKNNGIFQFSSVTSTNFNTELFSTLIYAIPYIMVPLKQDSLCGISFKQIVELLTRNVLHTDDKISSTSVNALKKIATRTNPSTLLTIYAKLAFKLSDKMGIYDPTYQFSDNFLKLQKLYTELLNCWLKSLIELKESRKKTVPENIYQKKKEDDLYLVTDKNYDVNQLEEWKPIDDIEWKSIITAIEGIEGIGLFFLCSQDPKTRYYSLSILKTVEQFDQVIYDITNEATTKKQHTRTSSKFVADEGTRLIHVLEEIDFMNLIKPFKKELSIPERTRLTKLKNKKNILLRLAESEQGIDSKIWFRLYPKVIEIFFERCPIPVAVCRDIVCVSLVQMHEIVSDYSEKDKFFSVFSKNPTGNIPPEILINQWKLYLIFVCTSLTTTGEQKISLPQQPTHGRKKSVPIFIQHQKITSAKSVFRMVLPLLNSSQIRIREAVILGLSHININIFKTFLENIPLATNDWNLDRRNYGDDRYRIEIIHIMMNLTAKFKQHDLIYNDDTIIANLVTIVKKVKSFLTLPDVQINIDFQRLRRYFAGFLENVYIGLQSKLDDWLPFEARISCFNYLKEWCGLGDSKGITEDRYDIMIQRVSKDSPAIALLDLERKKLDHASLSCMATLCSSQIKQTIVGDIAIVSFDIPGLMNWIECLLNSESEKVQEIGSTALKNLLMNNFDNPEIKSFVIKQCYTSHSISIIRKYFCTFADAYMEKEDDETAPEDIVSLAGYLCGNYKLDIRKSAVTLLEYLEEKHLKTNRLRIIVDQICSENSVIFKKAMYEMSVKMQTKPEKLFIRSSYLLKYFNYVNNDARKDIVVLLLPMVSKIVLNEDPPSLMLITNLIEITIKYGDSFSSEFQALWNSLATNNFDKVFEFLFKLCLEKKHSIFVQSSRSIINYLTLSNPLFVIEKLISNLQPKLMVPPQVKLNSPCDEFLDLPYVADLNKLIPLNEKDSAFSVGQLSMVFLADLLIEKDGVIIEKLPLLLHIVFSLLDHYLPIIREQAATLLIHIIHALSDDPKSNEVIKALRTKDNSKDLWVYDDLNNDKKGARTPGNMDLLIRNIISIFDKIPNLQDDWSRVALIWATTCAVRHIACRSFQIFRSLLSFLDQSMLKDMLHRLSNTISDETVDIQGFAMQILMTLNAITAELSSEKLIDFPQLFWSSVACLSTIHEQEFIEVLSTMNKFVSKIDLDASDTVSCLISTFPPKWEGRFEGLQQIVMVGLRSSTSWEPSLKFLDKLITLNDSQIIGMGNPRILTALLANMPRFLRSFDSDLDISTTALGISRLAENSNKDSLARILSSLAKGKFRSKRDFLNQTVQTIERYFFPDYEAQTLVLLLGLLSNKIAWVKLETMSILKLIFPKVDLQKDEFLGVGADLISPLLRLLLTEYADPALEVLDEAVTISGSQLDKDVLRMSLGNTSMKKEYENTATLFGIPDESGWSIPMPAVTSASTRNNVHAVFSTCLVTTDSVEKNEEAEVVFHLEEYYPPTEKVKKEIKNTDFYNDSNSVNVEDPPEASLSNVWAALDDFDSFFTKDADGNGVVLPISQLHSANVPLNNNYHGHSASVDTKYSTSSDNSLIPMDSAPNIYDKNVSLILNRSLARTQSNTSFKTNLADSIGNSPHSSNLFQSSIRRSYMPFKKTTPQNSSLTTPTLQTGFDKTSSSSSTLIKTPILTTPKYDLKDEGVNRFEGLLTGKKRSKKSIITKNSISPNASQTSISPDLHTQTSFTKKPTSTENQKKNSQKFK
ncbi:unnamed protein product [Candida verbasci]|uniref:Cell morphogenesis protein PAG1 n=1 Tax=Candida verbasci TaxID=1227364 RepID=A0A9W4XDJ7_9ASCO|nr:unnamed protein product [Candida verbasci]